VNGAVKGKGLSIVAFLAIIAMSQSQASSVLKEIDLSVLPDGKVRVGNGPELSKRQWRVKIDEFMRENPRPEIYILADKRVPYSAVVDATREIQLAGYGPYFGFIGDAR
jgi:biopolymer transport protein ExbD